MTDETTQVEEVVTTIENTDVAAEVAADAEVKEVEVEDAAE
jgi:hypothetical protein